MRLILSQEESIATDKKCQEVAQHKKDLKAQGVGSTIPASCKVTALTKKAVDESSDEEFDVIQVEIQAKEARVNALQAKLAMCNALHMKKLQLMDKEELQKLWDAGETGKPNPKEKEKVPVSNPSGSKVQAMGPAKKILATLSALSPVECASAKHKCPSPSTSKPQKSKAPSKSETSLLDSNTKKGAKKQASQQSQSEEDSDSEGKDKDEDKDEDEEESELEGEDEEDGNGKSTKLQKPSKGNAGCGKTKDFTGKVKKMVDFATICLCAKLFTTGMFCSPDEYKVLVNKCWVWVADEYHVDYQSSKYKIWKAHRQMIHDWVNSFHSCIQDRLRSAIARNYQLLGEGQTPKEAKEHIVGLLPNVFHTKVSAKKGIGHFQHDYLQDTIFEAYYTGNNPIGLAYSKLFHLMPLEVIALIQWVIKNHETGKYDTSNLMTFEKLQEYYDELMESLRAFQKGKQKDQCNIVWKSFYVRSMEQAGHPIVKPEVKPIVNILKDDDFSEDILTAEELKILSLGSSKPCHTSDVPQLLQTEKVPASSPLSDDPQLPNSKRSSPAPTSPMPTMPWS
ncbi:hypothetical protein FRC11_004773 [Ceratobasidium sp. 423]|nr:hypothetical protein FRC11_004773 [Ceratobasidium sp. 423]